MSNIPTIMSSPHSLLLLCFAAALLAGATGTTTINYRDALAKSIAFLQGQRSGKLDKSEQLNITWRGDSGLTDGRTAKVDLTGGYYDAGDNVKFNLPMAFTTTMLSWGAIEYAKRLDTELKHTHAAIRWGTDYLIKCATATPGVFYAQVGNPNTDHRCWERPEDMDTDRTAYSVTKGSDVAGETAAALAAASIVFRKVDSRYSRKLLSTAKNVMQFAMDHVGAYSDEIGSVVCPFYCSYSGYKDELLWGAAWMLQATNDNKYLNYIKSLNANDDSNIFSWDNKFGGARVLLSKRYLVGKKGMKDVTFQPFNQQAENFVCSILPGGGTTYTPGGLMYKIDGSNLQYVTAITFLLTTYAKYMAVSKNTFTCGGSPVTHKTLRVLARRQMDYILGDNPMGMSYMVGYGASYPQRIHHRGASLPSIYIHPKHISCGDGFGYMRASTPDPNLLLGAIVGGPDRSDHYADDPESYAQSEPTTYINAAAVGPLAYFASVKKHK